MNTCISVAVHKICYSATETVLCYHNNLYDMMRYCQQSSMMSKICQSLLCCTQNISKLNRCVLKHLLTSNSTRLVLCHSYCIVPEKIHTHPMEGHWKFLGGLGSQKPKF